MLHGCSNDEVIVTGTVEGIDFDFVFLEFRAPWLDRGGGEGLLGRFLLCTFVRLGYVWSVSQGFARFLLKNVKSWESIGNLIGNVFHFFFFLFGN